MRTNQATYQYSNPARERQSIFFKKEPHHYSLLAAAAQSADKFSEQHFGGVCAERITSPFRPWWRAVRRAAIGFAGWKWWSLPLFNAFLTLPVVTKW
jgi:hypothetical protein